VENIRLIPQSKEAEEAVIGSLLINPEASDLVFEILKHDDFYFTPTKLIFQAMEELFKNNEPVDILSVTERLNVKKQLETVGGELTIVHFADSVPIIGNVEYYSKLVKEKSTLRQIISVANRMIDASYEQKNADDIFNEAENSIFKIAEEKSAKTYMPIRDVINMTFEEIEHLKIEKQSPESGVYVSGIPSGFRDLDAMTSGFHKSDLAIIAARPSLGKTALALTLARNIALMYKYKVTFFSLEMSAEQLAQRLLCAEGSVDIRSLRSGSISPEDWKRITEAASKLKDMPMIIDDDPLLDENKNQSQKNKKRIRA
jgi:replicative DNA helicase